MSEPEKNQNPGKISKMKETAVKVSLLFQLANSPLTKTQKEKKASMDPASAICNKASAAFISKHS